MAASAFCSRAEIRRAIDKLNIAFLGVELPTRVKVEIGVQLLLTALHELPVTLQPAWTARVLGRLVQTSPPPSPQLAAAQTASSQAVRRGIDSLH